VLMCWVWGTDQGYANGRPDTAGLYCCYDFEKTSPNYALDKFGNIHGYLMGDAQVPQYVFDWDRALVLHGKDGYVELRKDVFDFKDTTIALWVLWEGGAANQKVLSFGSGSNKCMYLTPQDASGKTRFAVNAGQSGEIALTASALPVKRWSHVAVTFKGGVGTLYIDGKIVDTKPIPASPDALMGPNTLDGGTYAYLGRDAKGNYLNGRLDDFVVYSSAQSDSVISKLVDHKQSSVMSGSVAYSSRKALESSFKTPAIAKAVFKMKPTAISSSAIAMTAARTKDKDGYVEYYFKCMSGGGHDSGWISGSKYVDCCLKPGTAYTYVVKVRGKNLVETKPSASVSITTPTDNAAPKFGKSEWESAPKGISDTAIKMVATKASDINALVEYKITRDDGKGTEWQSSRTWVDNYLKPGSKHSYTVQARDGRGNKTAVSKAVSAIARDDTPPARFVKGEWVTPAYALLDGKVALRARPVHASGGRAVSIEDNEVEYFYKCLSGGGPDSGWISDPHWDTAALADGTYVYEFKIRDKSPQLNETGWSVRQTVTVSNMTGYHSYSVGQLAALPESALVTFDGKITEVGKDFYTVTNGGASVKVMPRTKGSATDASLADKDVTVKGGTWIVSGEKRVTWADVNPK